MCIRYLDIPYLNGAVHGSPIFKSPRFRHVRDDKALKEKVERLASYAERSANQEQSMPFEKDYTDFVKPKEIDA